MSSRLPAVVSLGELLRAGPVPQPCLIEPGLLPSQGILFCGGEPKIGKSILVTNLALALAAGSARTGFEIPAPRRVLICQFELPTEQFAARLSRMRQPLGAAADANLFIDTRAAGHLLSTPQGLHHFIAAAQTAAAEVIVLDPLYSTHDQDENDTRAMAALCQTLLRLRDASKAALIVVHHLRKSISRYEVGTAFRGSSALNAVGDSYVLLARPSAAPNVVELRFQFRYAAARQPKLLSLDPRTLWYAPAGDVSLEARPRRKVEGADVEQALAALGNQAGYNDLRARIMAAAACSKRTAQIAIAQACREQRIIRNNGRYRIAIDFAAGSRRLQNPSRGQAGPEG
jgi:hypothetical protein